jgi:GR25 family glycosyltransferase involved in LPS biosynthesis
LTGLVQVQIEKQGNGMIRWFLTFTCAITLLRADLQDYFKPVLEKSGFHQMRNIDFIYMINLDERPEKYALSIEKLAPYAIFPCRFSAVNGWKLSLEELNDTGVRYESWMANGVWGTMYLPENEGRPEHEILGRPGKIYFCHCMAPGAVGCTLSHLSILQDALDSKYETIWIMEDDIEIIQDPHILSDLIEELDLTVGKEGWDVLFTDPDSKNSQGNYVPCSSYAWRPNYTPSNTDRFAQRSDVGALFRKIGSRYGSYSMILRRSGIKKILNFLKCYQIFLPYDMEYTQPPNIRLFTVREDIVSTVPSAPSDNGAPNYAPIEFKIRNSPYANGAAFGLSLQPKCRSVCVR